MICLRSFGCCLSDFRFSGRRGTIAEFGVEPYTIRDNIAVLRQFTLIYPIILAHLGVTRWESRAAIPQPNNL